MLTLQGVTALDEDVRLTYHVVTPHEAAPGGRAPALSVRPEPTSQATIDTKER